MKSKHITSFVVAITLLMVFQAALRAQTESESIIPSELGFTNSGPVLSILGTNCTVFFDQGSNRYGNRPRYYSNGEAIRLYAGNEMSVETSGSNRIVSIQITFATGGSNIPMTATPGSFDGTTWTGSTNEVVFSVGGTSGHRRVKKLDITYATGVEPPVISGTTPFASSTTATITVASGAANGTTIHYTTNGTTPTENSTQYSNPIAINATTTIKAIARYNNVNSSVATMTFVSDANNWGGSGTQADPFLITNTTKMNDLASLVNGGKSYRGVYFRLDADLTYTGSNNYTPIGKPGYPFEGTFDGNGHSISGIDISTAGTTDADSYKGIFGQVGDYGTVRNLTLSNSTIDAYNHTGGIVGYNWGTIENCHVRGTVTIHSHLGGSHGQGGIVGTNSNYVYGCTSAANITMGDGLSSVTGRGGIAGENSFHSSIGYSNSISNCLYLGDNVQGTSDYGTIIGDVSADLISSYPIYCYYTLQTSGLHALGGSDYGTCQEAYTLTSGTVGLSLLCDGALPNPDYVEQYGDYINGDLYNATLTYGGLIYSPSGQTVTFSLAVPDNYSYSGVTASAGTLTDNGDGTFSLTMPAANVTITATLEGLPWSGSGTENDPYIISTVAEYNSFANRVSGGVGIAQNCFNGMYFQLAENLNVSTMVGSSETNCFKGVFDGDGHTLTVSLNDNGQGVAPFHYISGATIKNLVVAGSVTATDYHASGLVGFTAGTNTIDNCLVSTTLNINTLGGGIVGHAKSATNNITGCVFNGTINNTSSEATNDRAVGGLVGWSDKSTVSISASLFAGAYNWSGNHIPFTPMIAKRADSTVTATVANTYYTIAPDDEGNDGYVNIVATSALPVPSSSIAAGQWHAIAAPMHGYGAAGLAVSDIYNLTDGSYDLLRYNEAQCRWENQKPSGTGFSTLDAGRGYIYRRTTEETLRFAGLPNLGSVSCSITASSPNDAAKGFNLVGNPYPHSILRSDISTGDGASLALGYYALQPDGTWLAHTTEAIAVGQAFLVQATAGGTLTFSDNSSSKAKGNSPNGSPTLAFSVTNDQHQDIAYAVIGTNDEGLRKISHLSPDAPAMSIPLEGSRYAIAAIPDSTNSFPLSLVANPGEYTLTFNSELLTVTYLHLVDCLTGIDIDLLHTPSYTFKHPGNQSIASRFLVRLSPNKTTGDNTSQDCFAHQSVDKIIVEGVGTLKAYDVTGRMLFNVGIQNSKFEIQNSQFPSPGVYILRLNERSQKIVIR